MRKLLRVNMILSAFALIIALSSFQAFCVHPTDATKFLAYEHDNITIALMELSIAYDIISIHEAYYCGPVHVFQCPGGLYFNPVDLYCDLPENCAWMYDIDPGDNP